MSIDERVLELAHTAFEISRKITEPVDFHKRYNADDLEDPHVALIDWVYQTGSVLFRGGKL